MTALNREMTFDTDPTVATTTAAEAFALRRGVCQDLTHIFIAAARRLGIPARYVGGHFYRVDGVTEQDAGHAWAEAFVEDLGWVGFDPTNGICTTEPMCGSRSASIISARRRCAARATAAAAKPSKWRSTSIRRASRRKVRVDCEHATCSLWGTIVAWLHEEIAESPLL